LNVSIAYRAYLYVFVESGVEIESTIEWTEAPFLLDRY